MNPPQAPEPAKLEWRLTSLEHKVDEGFTLVNHRFDSLVNDVRTLAFLRQDVYLADKAAIEERVQSMRDRTANAIKLATLAITLTVGIGLAAVFALVQLA